MDLASLPGAHAARLPQLLADIETLVRCESPSADLSAVAASAHVLAAVGARAARDRARADRGGRADPSALAARPGPARVLLLGHHDTVSPAGPLATHPFAVTGDVLRGPGLL